MPFKIKYLLLVIQSKKTDHNTKINEIEKKITNLVTKTEFDNKLTSFNKRITSNKKKHLKFEKKLGSLITKDYNFFLGRTYFTSNDGFQNMFFY